MRRTITTLTIVAMLCSAFLAGCGDDGENGGDRDGTQQDAKLEVSFATGDGVTIFADYFKPEGAKKAAILVHDKGQDRSVWGTFAAKLNSAGYATLALDLRGHGKSVKQGEKTLDYRDFTDMWNGERHLMQCQADIAAGVKFLESKGFAKARIAAIGAGDGADIVAVYCGNNPEESKIAGLALISPELRDYGSTIKCIASIRQDKVFIYYCKDDADCGESNPDPQYGKRYQKIPEIVEEYKSQIDEKIIAREYDGAAHGTAMLAIEGVAGRIIEDIDSLFD